MITIAISHHIYLSREDRYSLFKGNTIEVIGVSVPVWFLKGTTSEPAIEVFCKYTLTNSEEDYPVTAFIKGYKINLPQVPAIISSRPNNWEEMTMAEQDKWSKEHPYPSLPIDLLDAKDGGIGCLRFKKYSKIKENEKRLNTIHAVEIYPIEKLINSLAIDIS